MTKVASVILHSPSSEANGAVNDLYRVMIVDDSAVIRGVISRALDGKAGLKVVGTAANGQRAIDLLRREPLDVIILDVEMPVMDGLTAIPLLKAVDPAVQIIMASTLTQKNADISLKALNLGATDYIAKPSSTPEQADLNADRFNHELIEKVRELGALARRRGVRVVSDAHAPMPLVRALGAGEKKKIELRPLPKQRPDVIAIGSSTGGPQALFETIRNMGADLAQSILITQHMPPAFTTLLAEHIQRQCGVQCVEASEGLVLRTGHYYLAPGDFHMLLTRRGSDTVIRLTKDAPENFCRPSVDPMLRSLVEIYQAKVLAVILTGMGSDGLKGCQAVVAAGGAVLAQNEATSVVWGMPGAVAMAGVCSAVLPVQEIGAAVRKIAGKGGVL